MLRSRAWRKIRAGHSRLPRLRRKATLGEVAAFSRKEDFRRNNRRKGILTEDRAAFNHSKADSNKEGGRCHRRLKAREVFNHVKAGPSRVEGRCPNRKEGSSVDSNNFKAAKDSRHLEARAATSPARERLTDNFRAKGKLRDNFPADKRDKGSPKIPSEDMRARKAESEATSDLKARK